MCHLTKMMLMLFACSHSLSTHKNEERILHFVTHINFLINTCTLLTVDSKTMVWSGDAASNVEHEQKRSRKHIQQIEKSQSVTCGYAACKNRLTRQPVSFVEAGQRAARSMLSRLKAFILHFFHFILFLVSESHDRLILGFTNFNGRLSFMLVV